MISATLFSGIGAPETAMPSWDWRWSAEFEKFPSAVLAERHPHTTNLGDVTANDFTDRARAIASPDIIVFGSPCQSYSIAGKRLGLDDPRGNLALVALRIIAELEPRWFVFENVPGLLSSSKGCDFGIFLKTVDELRYSGAWGVLDAQHFGVAQRRKRVFFVGHSGDWRHPAAVLLEPQSVCGNSAPSRQARESLAASLRASASPRGHGHSYGARCDGNDNLVPTFNNTGHGWWTEDQVASGLRTPQGGGSREATVVDFGGNRTSGPIDCATAVNAHGGPCGRMDFESETFVTHALRADGFDASEDGTGRGTPLIAFSCKDHGADAMDNLSPTLRSGAHDRSHANAGVPPAVAFQTSQSGVRVTETHATLDSNNGSRRHNGTFSSSAVRRLTPRECEHLQGFPDDYTNITYRNKPAADGPRYKALGNSMAVPVMRWILRRIEAVDG